MPTNSSPMAHQIGLDQLAHEVEELRERVVSLEQRLGTQPVLPQPPEAASLPAAIHLPPNMVTLLGRMLLAIAGAYVLRALTEWGALPARAGVAVGLLYAVAWLWVAARSPAEAKLAAAIGCTTSVLIVAPLLWEATGRLGVMSSVTSATVLVAFAVVAMALGSRTRHSVIVTIVGVASVGMSLVLLVAHNDIVPFTIALLAIAAANEVATWYGLRPGTRSVAALAADASILLFSGLMSSPRGMPETWVAAAPPIALGSQMALVVIYAATVLTQSAIRRRTLSLAEIVQGGAALLIGLGGAVWDFGDHRGVMLGIGIPALAAGFVFYRIAFLLFEQDSKRNFRGLSTFGLFFVLAGIFLPFSRTEFWVLSCVCGVVCCLGARAFALPTLGLHGALYLLLGSITSNATSQPLGILFAIGDPTVNWPASIVVLAVAAACWGVITGMPAGSTGRLRNQISACVSAALAVWVAAGVATYAIVAFWPHFAGRNVIPADTLGTVVVTGLSLALSWVGTRWKKPELAWVLYGLMAMGGYKLVVRDFIHEHSLALVVSLLCYGGCLMILPRMRRVRAAAEDLK